MDVSINEELIPEGQRDQARRLVETYRGLLKENPLLGYEPHSKQVPFHGSTTPIKLFLGGNRSGKTTAGILDDIIQAVDRSVVPDHLQRFKKFEPPFKCWIVAGGFDVLESVVYEKLQDWLPPSQLAGGSWARAFDKQNRFLKLKNGSRFTFKSCDQDVQKFSGAAVHRVHYDEEPDQRIRVECRYRLLDYKGADELFTMTPVLGMSWMYDKFWEPYLKGRLRNASITLVDMDENPHIDEDQKRMALEDAGPEELKARKQGRFVHFAGMIYDEFSPHVHVLPSQIPEDAGERKEFFRSRKVFVGIDPGIRHMAAVLWAYLDQDDTLVVFDELGVKGQTVKDVAVAIHRVNQEHGVQPEWYVIDPAARNVITQTGRSDQMEFADHGIVTIAGQNSVTAGINRVKERLASERLLINATCEQTIYQFRKYRWKTPLRSEDDPKEAPIKTDDHLLDALRYLVMSRPQPPEARREEQSLRPLEKAKELEVSGRGWGRKRVPRTEFGGMFA